MWVGYVLSVCDVCVWCLHVFECVCVPTESPERTPCVLLCHSLPYSFEMGSLPESQWTPEILLPLSSPVLGPQTFLWPFPAFYVGTGDLNSGRHAHTPSSLTCWAIFLVHDYNFKVAILTDVLWNLVVVLICILQCCVCFQWMLFTVSLFGSVYWFLNEALLFSTWPLT